MKTLILSLLLLFTAPLSAPPDIDRVELLSFASGTCTTFAINEEKRYWMTAKHCLESGELPTLAGLPTHVVTLHPDADVAILVAQVGAPGFKLAERGPRVGDEVRLFARHYGSLQTWETRGIVSARQLRDDFLYDVFNVQGSPGASGGVYLKGGKVVGLHQGYFKLSTGLAFVVPFEQLAKLRDYFE